MTKGDTMSQEVSKEPSRFKVLITMIAVVCVIGLIIKNPERFGNIAIVLFGFGAVIFVHEFGHFSAARSIGCLVETFAIGFGPIVAGLKRVENGLQIRVLPGLLGESKCRWVLPHKGSKAGDTEYQIRLIPLGGFVKILGQEDLGADQASADPRSFLNKTVGQRCFVLSAGVLMNVICGAIVFIIIFSRGVNLPPAVVGGVMAGSPAEAAGLRAGDEIVSINGKEHLSFEDLILAGAFSDEGEKVSMQVRHPDGQEEAVSMEPAVDGKIGIRRFGIEPATDLKIALLQEKKALEELKEMGISPGDRIVAVNGQAIQRYDELATMLCQEPGASNPGDLEITFQREEETYTISLPVKLGPWGQAYGSVLGMLPLTKVFAVLPGSPAEKAGVLKEDILIRFGELAYPTNEALIQFCQSHENQVIDLTVLRRVEQRYEEITLQLTPGQWNRKLWQIFQKSRATIGVVIPPAGLEVPIVAGMMAKEEKQEEEEEGEEEESSAAYDFSIPQGSRITAVNDQAVGNWQEIIEVLLASRGQEATLSYLPSEGEAVEKATVSVPEDASEWLGFSWQADFGALDNLPLMPLLRVYRGDTLYQALRMGLDRTYGMIAQTYLTLRGIILGTVSAKAVSGPVGILKMSYTIVKESSVTYFLYFMAMISTYLAVFNFLPLPILDGGQVVLLFIEKIKGSPVSERIQSVISYIGLVLLLSIFFLVTLMDIFKVAKGEL